MRNIFHLDNSVLKYWDEENVLFIDVQEGTCKICGKTFHVSLDKSKVFHYGEWKDGCPDCHSGKSVN